METQKAIFLRRSIRKYSAGTIDRNQLTEIVKAGMYAPSARNKQPWQFIVIDDELILRKLSEAHPYGKMLAEASAAIVVCGDLEKEDNKFYQLQNCSAATQNILLSIHDLGLGAVWLGLQPRKERISAVNKVLNIPSHIFPVSLISIGHPDEVKEMPDRFNPELLHFNAY